jgi:preprotein translocase subunit SecG
MNILLISQIFQIVLCVVLSFLTLIQTKGGGLSGSFAGSISFYRSRRGLEKGIFVLTILLGILLVANSLLIVVLS